MEKVALVTGSTKGIGKAIALSLLEKGLYVFFNYYSDDNACLLLKNELSEKGYTNYSIIKADASSEEGIAHILESIKEREYSLEYLVLNASSNGEQRSLFRQITREEMTSMFEKNFFGPFFLVQKLSEILNDDGAILFISSAMGIYPHSTYIPYGVTKAAEIFLAKSLVKEFAEKHIRVNVIAPHCIETEMFPGNRAPEQLNDMKKSMAVRRFGNTQSVAQAALLALSNVHMNGAVINVDGGYNYK